MSKLIQEVITRRLITISKGNTVAKALQMMNENNFRHLPVVDQSNKIVGIASDSDFLRVADFERAKVEDMMTAPVFSIVESVEIEAGVKLMLEKRISSLIVLDGKERPVGILTTEDVLREFVNGK